MLIKFIVYHLMKSLLRRGVVMLNSLESTEKRIMMMSNKGINEWNVKNCFFSFYFVIWYILLCYLLKSLLIIFEYKCIYNPPNQPPPQKKMEITRQITSNWRRYLILFRNTINTNYSFYCYTCKSIYVVYYVSSFNAFILCNYECTCYVHSTPMLTNLFYQLLSGDS